MSLHKNACPRLHEIYNFCRPYLCHCCVLSLSIPCPGLEKIFKEIHIPYKNLHFNTPNYLLWCGSGGREIYNFLSPYPTNATYQIWLRSWEEDEDDNAKPMTYTAQWRMPTHSNTLPASLRWPKKDFQSWYYMSQIILGYCTANLWYSQN